MIHIRRMLYGAVATIAVVSAAPAIAQEHDQHAAAAQPAEAHAPATCPMMAKPAGPDGAAGPMQQHMAEMHQAMQQMREDMQAMRSEMMQMRQDMQRRR